MIRSLFFILGLCTTLNLFAGDTLLVNVMSFPKPIQSMANDRYGNIFVSFGDGLYQLIDDKGDLNLINPDFKGDMIFLDSLVFISGNKDQPSLAKKLTDLRITNLSWLSLLPVSDHHTVLDVAKDSNDFIYVSTKNRIYIFKVDVLFTKYLPLHSTRGILEWNNEIYCNTYSGLFEEKDLLTSEILGGDLFAQNNDTLFASFGIDFFYMTNGQINKFSLGKSFRRWAGHKLNIIQIERNSQGEWLLGTEKGLIIPTRDSFLRFLEESVIEEIQPFSDGFLLSTSTGVFLFNNSHEVTAFQTRPLRANQTILDGDHLYIAADEGLFMHNLNRSQTTQIKLSQQDGNPVKAYSLVKDNFGFLWCGTNKGLYRIKLVNIQFEKFLDGVDFNKRSCLKLNGTIYMGTSSGVYSWIPSAFSDEAIQKALLTKANPVSQDSQNTSKANQWLLLFGGAIGLTMIFLAIHFAKKRTPRQVEVPESLPEDAPEIEEKPFQETVISFIDNHIDSVTVESLLDHFGMIKKDFYKEFKIHFNQTPGQLIRDKRKEKVIQALQSNPDTDITILAKEVGYSERHIQNILNSKDFSKLREGRA